MSVIAIEGFDSFADDDDAKLKFNVTSKAGLAPGRNGGQSFWCGRPQPSKHFSGGVQNSTQAPRLYFSPTSDITLGMAFFPGYYNYRDTSYSGVALGRNGIAQIMVIFNIETGRVEVRKISGNVTLAQSDFRWSPNRWYYLEIKINGGSGVNDGSFEVRINEETILTANSINTNYSDGKFDDFAWGAQTTSYGSGATCGVDDLYVLDNTKPGLQDFLGDVDVTTLVPNADRSVTWNANPTGDHYENVDDGKVLNDSNYIESNVVGNQDIFDLENIVVEPTEIFAISNRVRARKDVPGTRKLKVGSEDSSNTQSMSDEIILSTEWDYYDYIQEKSPSGIEWSVEDINSNGLIVEVA